MKKTLALPLLALALTAAPMGAEEKAVKEKEKPKCESEATVCIRKMAESLRERGWIGIEWHNEAGRPTITLVVQESPASRAGVAVGDVVMTFNGVDTAQGEETVYQEIKRSLIPGNTITLTVARAGERLELPVELVPVPEHVLAQWVGKHVLEFHSQPPEDKVGSP